MVIGGEFQLNMQIAQMIDKAMDGGKLTAKELHSLFSVHCLSEEAFIVRQAARKMSQAASQNKAEVHAQVGLDSGPCAKDCQFCAFAAGNKVFSSLVVRTEEEVLESCLALERDGANALYLMGTARYKFGDFIRMGQVVREALQPETILIANTDDFDDEGARKLKKVGFDGIYHVVHMGEGRQTGIAPQTRLKTINSAKRAGLLVGTAVEPIGPEHSVDELTEKTLMVRNIFPVHAGAGRRVRIPSSPLTAGELNSAQTSYLLAVVKLAVGYEVRGHCGGHGLGGMAGVNLTWTEVGSNPRDTERNTLKGATVKLRREELQESGWEILEGPSVMFGRRN